jgi:HSP20 family molecular chaperone IbpA
MQLTQWNPVREMLTMQSVLDRMREAPSPAFHDNTRIPLDIHETGHSYELIAALPGADPQSIQVRLHDGVLTLSAEVRSPFQSAVEGTRQNGNGNGNAQQPQARTLLLENVYGKYARSIRLPELIEEESVQAAYDNGVLVLTLPKSPKAQPRQIAVNVKR